MKSFLLKLPVPAGCVALGLIGLGTLLAAQNSVFLLFFGGISLLIQLSVILKLFIPGARKAVCSDYAALSTLAGTSMAIMLTAAQAKKVFSFSGSAFFWYAGLLFHLLIIILFSRKLLHERPGLNSVRGSWLLVYVGIAAAAISAPVFSAARFGLLLLIPAALGAVILLPLVYHADLASGTVSAAQKPLFCITAAPVSIWLAGYLSSCASPSRPLTAVLLILAQLLYLPALLRCIRNLRQPFSPAFAAFTFPFVISATALKQASILLGLSSAVRIFIDAETLIALLLCLYTLWLYLRFLFGEQLPDDKLQFSRSKSINKNR